MKSDQTQKEPFFEKAENHLISHEADAREFTITPLDEEIIEKGIKGDKGDPGVD